MKKRFAAAILTLLLALTMTFTAAAMVTTDFHPPRLVDNADLLTASEESSLLQLLDYVSERQQCDVAVVTVDSLGGKSAQAYADDYYDYNGYGMGVGDDGVLLLVAMNEREWHITTYGMAINAINHRRIDFIAEDVLEYLSGGYYYNAFVIFAEECEYYLSVYREDPYGEDESLGTAGALLIALAIGLVIGLIATSVMKGKLNSVRAQKNAAGYVRQGSFDLVQSRDIFLYRHVTRRVRQQSSGGSGTHRSSSGRSHGGGGGRF